MDDKTKSDLCLQCLACCKVTHIPVYVADIRKAEEFYSAKGFKTREFNGTIFLEIQGDCPQLTRFGCKIYPVRPRVCAEFDGRLAPFIQDICLWKED